MSLSRRLFAVARQVPPDCVIADIGTDHALLPAYLVEKGTCPRAIAGDLNPGPVRAARETVQTRGLQDKIEIRRGDGLGILRPGEADVVILAGMGGHLITQILQSSPGVLEKVRRLIVQPNNKAPVLRSWLAGRGWGIVEEDLVEEEGKVYPVIVSEPGRGMTAVDPVSLEVGPCLLKKGGLAVQRLLLRKEKEYAKIMEGLSVGSGTEVERKKEKIQELLAGIKEVLGSGCKS